MNFNECRKKNAVTLFWQMIEYSKRGSSTYRFDYPRSFVVPIKLFNFARRGYVGFVVSYRNSGYYWKLLTSKVFSELLLHLQCSFVRFFRLFLGHSLVHFPLNTKQSLVKPWTSSFSKTKIIESIATYITDSTDFGLMKMAMGYSCATCNLLMAFPLTSRIQCFPCHWFSSIYVNTLQSIIIYYRDYCTLAFARMLHFRNIKFS